MKVVIFPDFGNIGSYPEVRKYILFSYPHNVEERGEKRILSSGTWGIASMKRGNYKERDWQHLYSWYKENSKFNNTGWYMMPDEYLRPKNTMQNFLRWKKLYPDIDVVPIIQFKREKEIDLLGALEQIEFYMQFNPVRICISNPAMEALQWNKYLSILGKKIKSYNENCWIHVLGAGWSFADIKNYIVIDEIDSIDTIAYYTDAKQHKVWYTSGHIDDRYDLVCDCPVCSNSAKKDWKGIALHNAFVIQKFVERERLRCI